MSKTIVIGSAVVVVVLFVSALIGDAPRRNLSGDAPLVPPQANPHPTERVELHVIAPSSLNLSLGVVYSVGVWLSPRGGAAYCGPYADLSAHPTGPPPVKITLPVALKWDGSAYQGEFYIDRYLPGSCRWEFSGLYTLSPVKDFVSLYKAVPIKYNFDTRGSHGIYDQSADQSAERWCGADPAPSQHGGFICTSLSYFVGYPGVVSNELWASIPAERRAHFDMVNIFPYTRSITLRFHDLAVENQAAMASRSIRDTK